MYLSWYSEWAFRDHTHPTPGYLKKLKKLGLKEKIVLHPEIGRVKTFLSLTHLHSRMCIRIYTFNFKNQRNKPKKQGYKKAKESKEEKRISPENWLKKNNLRPPGWTFFSSPAFPETRIYILFGIIENFFIPGEEDFDFSDKD